MPTQSTPTPRLAVLLPAFDPGERLARTLDSIARQEEPCEVFVVDDGSTPALRVPVVTGPHRVHTLRLERNVGIAAALNHGLRYILGRDFEFIARHDVGDVDIGDRLARQVAYLREHPDVALVGSSAVWVDPKGAVRFRFRAPSEHAAIVRKMRYSAALIHSTCMFRASALRELGEYSERYPCAEDYELFFRVMRRHRVANLETPLVHADYNVDGISLSRRRRSLHSRLRLQLRFFDFLDPHSYLGVAQTAGLFLMPSGLVSRVKRTLSRAR